MEVKNLFVNFENGENCLVYTYDLTEDEVKQFAEKVTGETVLEVYHVPQNDLQYIALMAAAGLILPKRWRKYARESLRNFIALM